MFPHPGDLLASACKVQRDNDLMIAAMKATKTPYPKSVTLTSPDDLRPACQNMGLVIKRDFSDSTTCTFLPGADRETKVRDKFVETQSLYRGICCLPYPSWIGQPYMPSLVEKGEIRAFVVGGKVMYAVHTWPIGDRQGVEVVDNYTPLESLQ
jgi:hypothetical protein